MATIADIEQWIAELELAITVAEAAGDSQHATALRARLPLLYLKRMHRLRATNQSAARLPRRFGSRLVETR